MFLKELVLRYFRNYESLTLPIEQNRVLFVGKNAQGKTNLLEAIRFLSLGRSPRTYREEELIQWGREVATLQGEFLGRGDLPSSIDMILKRSGRKSVKVNGKKQASLLDFVGKLPSIYFSSEDLSLIKGSPEARRTFLDTLLSQSFSRYGTTLQQYQKVLKQRNALLKSEKGREAITEGLSVWDPQLAHLGTLLIQHRIQLLKQLGKHLSPLYQQLTDGREETVLEYWGNVSIENESDIRGYYIQQLQRHRWQELLRKQTLVGPHRDDFLLMLQGKSAKNFASQGEQRSLVLALKLAEMIYLRDQMGSWPLLLLDDVFSELDKERQQFLIEAIPKEAQLFLSTTHLEGIPWAKETQMIEVSLGTIRPLDQPHSLLCL